MVGWNRKKRPSKRLVVTFCEHQLFIGVVAMKDQNGVLEQCVAHTFTQLKKLTSELGELIKQHHWQGLPVCVVLAKDDYRLMQVERPQVGDDELNEAIKWRIKDLVESSVDELAIQCFEKPVDESRGMPKQVNVVVVPKERLRHLIDVFQDNHLSIEAIDIPELAIRNLLQLYPEVEQGVAALVETCNGIYLLLQKLDTVYLSRQLMSRDFQAIRDELAQGETGSIDQLILELHRSMDFYENQLGQSPVKHLLLGPVVGECEDIINYFESNLPLRLMVINLEGILSGVPEDLEISESLNYVMSAGEGLRALEV